MRAPMMLARSLASTNEPARVQVTSQDRIAE
jgi:hypothetical protein